MEKNNNTISDFDQETINEVQDLFQEYIVGKIKSEITKLEKKTNELDERFNEKFKETLLTTGSFFSKANTIKREAFLELIEDLDTRKKDVNKIIDGLKTSININLSSLKDILKKISNDSKKISEVSTLLIENEQKNQNNFLYLQNEIETSQKQLNDKFNERIVELSNNIDNYSKSTNDVLKENASKQLTQLSIWSKKSSEELSTIDEKMHQQQNFHKKTILPEIQNITNKLDESTNGITKNFSVVIDGSTEKILTEILHIKELINEVEKNIEQYTVLNKEYNDSFHVFMDDVNTNFNELNVTKKEDTENMKKILFWVFVLFGINISISIGLLLILLIR